MISYWKNTETGYRQISKWEPNCWVNIENPTQEELGFLRGRFDIPEEFVGDIFDIDERPRTEVEDNWQLVITRIPYHQSNQNLPFITIPLGFLFCDEYRITICYFESEVLRDYITHTQNKRVNPLNHIEFFLTLFFSVSVWYLKYLKQINLQTQQIEQELEKSVKNRELHRLLRMEKCLVYFITSLKGNEILLHKLKGSRFFSRLEFDPDYLEDLEIEMKQAIETALIYSDIQSGLMDAFASVISNNLNHVMKQLTAISIFLMIPTLVASWFGMNVPNFMESNNFAFSGIVIFSLLIAIIGFIFFKRIKWF